MQRGKRKSPFIGSSEALGNSAGPILYFRYNSLSDILLDGSAPLPASTKGEEPVKKKPKREKVKKTKPVGEAAPAQQKKKQKRPKGPRKLAPEERVSGPGNAHEALKMREALGFVAATLQETIEEEAAAQHAARPTFAFGFGRGGTAATVGGQKATTAAAAATAPSGQRKSNDNDTSSSSEPEDSSSDSQSDAEEQPAAAVNGSDDSGSDSGSESDSESESESEDKAVQPAAGGGSSSSESEDSSDELLESDDDDKANGTAAKAVPQSTQQPLLWASPAPPVAVAPLAEDEDGEYVPRRVYVGGMPFGYSEDKIHEYWSYCGEIEGMDIMTFPDTGRFRGIVFITFVTQEGYEAALGCDGEQCDGQTLKVQKCKWGPKERAARERQREAQQQAPAPVQQQQVASPMNGNHGVSGFAAVPQRQQSEAGERRQHQSPAPKTEGYNVAYVGNIAFEADEKELQRLFEGYNVTKVRLHTDKDTGRSKGFAHIHFKDAESLECALALNGTQLHGRKIKMGYAQPKKDQ